MHEVIYERWQKKSWAIFKGKLRTIVYNCVYEYVYVYSIDVYLSVHYNEMSVLVCLRCGCVFAIL